jgi:hypothetical protein
MYLTIRTHLGTSFFLLISCGTLSQVHILEEHIRVCSVALYLISLRRHGKMGDVSLSSARPCRNLWALVSLLITRIKPNKLAFD